MCQLSIYNSFPVIRTASAKNRRFHVPQPTFLFDAPGAITLNVVWMESEFDAYKLSRFMCPSNYNRFSDRATYWSKIVIFHIPLAFDAPVSGGSRRISAIPPICIGLQRRVVLQWFYSPRAVGTTLSEVHALYRVPY